MSGLPPVATAGRTSRFGSFVPEAEIEKQGGPLPSGYIGSISPGRQVLLNHGSSGPYSRKRVFQPLPGIVCTQLASLPAGTFGPN
jgi:hypothetical protein